MSRKWTSALAATCGVAVVVLGVIWGYASLHRRPPTRRELWAQPKEIEKQYAGDDESAVVLAELAEDELKSGIEARVHDPDRLLNEGQRQSLIELLAKHVRARASPSAADAYIALVESSPGVRWIGPDDANWGRIDKVFEKYLRFDLPDRSRPADALRAYVEAIHSNRGAVERGGPVRALRLGQRGISIEVYRIRTEKQILSILVDRLGKTETDYWAGAGFEAAAVGALRFSVPTRSLSDVLVQEHGTIIATTMLVLTLENGDAFNWTGYWYWDSESGAWQCDEMVRKGRLGPLYQ